MAIGFPRCRRAKSINFRQKPTSRKLRPAMYLVPRMSIRTKQHLPCRDGRTSSSTPTSPATGAVDPKKGFHFGGQCFFTNGWSRNFISTILIARSDIMERRRNSLAMSVGFLSWFLLDLLKNQHPTNRNSIKAASLYALCNCFAKKGPFRGLQRRWRRTADHLVETNNPTLFGFIQNSLYL